MTLKKDIGWWYWAIMDILLIEGISDCPLGFAPAVALAGVQSVHYLRREGSVAAFPVQVRIAYLLLLLLAQWEPLRLANWIYLAGTTAAVVVDYCILARIMSLLPWNRCQPITYDLVMRTFLSRPVNGNILHAVLE